mmetsp:Transcript_14907/g.20438  ORF Transcript_14907/g.20438 Transcript_14907/m.20438 type:complete len:208 (-) Transcript_14907:911-1534(-)
MQRPQQQGSPEMADGVIQQSLASHADSQSIAWRESLGHHHFLDLQHRLRDASLSRRDGQKAADCVHLECFAIRSSCMHSEHEVFISFSPDFAKLFHRQPQKAHTHLWGGRLPRQGRLSGACQAIQCFQHLWIRSSQRVVVHHQEGAVALFQQAVKGSRTVQQDQVPVARWRSRRGYQGLNLLGHFARHVSLTQRVVFQGLEVGRVGP